MTNLAPLPLELPAPIAGSWIFDDRHDPHLEPESLRPRAPFLAPIGATNLAFQKRVTSSDSTVSAESLARITDGRKETCSEGIVSLRTKKQWIQVDLGAPSGVYAIVVWHDQSEHRIFRCVVVQTADDAEFTRNVRTLYNNDYANELELGTGSDKVYRESHQGRLVDAKGISARFVRCYSKGSNINLLNEYTEVEVWGVPQK